MELFRTISSQQRSHPAALRALQTDAEPGDTWEAALCSDNGMGSRNGPKLEQKDKLGLLRFRRFRRNVCTEADTLKAGSDRDMKV